MLSHTKVTFAGLCAALALFAPATAAAPVDTRSAATLHSSEDASTGVDGSLTHEFLVLATDEATGDVGGASWPSEGKIKVSSIDSDGDVVKEQFLALGDHLPGDVRDENSTYVCAVDSEDDAAVFRLTRGWRYGTYVISVAGNEMSGNDADDFAVDWFLGVPNELPTDTIASGEPRLAAVKDSYESAMWQMSTSPDKMGYILNLFFNRDPSGPFRGVSVFVPSSDVERDGSSSYVAVTKDKSSASLVDIEG